MSAVAAPESSLATEYKHYIDGAWVAGSSSETVPIVNPATGQAFAHVPRATAAEAEAAVRAARKAFDEGPWSRLSGADRSKILHQWADAMWRRREEFVDTVVRQGGCTVTLARGMQVYTALEWMFKFADLAKRNPIERTTLGGGPYPGGHGTVGTTMVVREPVGVVSAITPFNYPFFLNVHKAGPALASGCSVVLKPTEYTCLDAALMAKIADEETDLPPGVFNVLLGAKADVGELLATHPLVDHVSFTGSTATGRKIMSSAGQTIKKVTLELGGKGANIIFADADLDKALGGECALVIRHCGQGCGHLSRVFAQRPIYDEVLRRMAERAKTVVIGDPADPRTEMGPLVSQAQWDRVKAHIDSAVEQGATLVTGGDRPEGHPDGYFMAPTIFTGGDRNLRIFQEEIFGPVVLVQPFDTEEEVIALANDTIYGLTGSVWTQDINKGLRVAGRVRAGMVSLNGRANDDGEVPYGGYKQSGIGREFGEWGFEEYTELKTLRYAL